MADKTYFFCGIGGSGMSALALILLQKGCCVYGSDRGHDKGETPEKFGALAQAGIKLFPQDGSGVSDDVDVLVVSSAVEESVPDVRQAIHQGIPVRKRAAVLAGQVNASRGICIGGTSGKTTVTGMVAHMLYELGLDPSVMNGGQIVSFLEKGLPGNARAGAGDLFITETDESDGSIALFEPAIAVLNNITLDHKPLEELRPLFSDFLGRAGEAAIVNLDDPEAAQLAALHENTITFAIDNPAGRIRAEDISASGFTASDMDRRESIGLSLPVPGRHNILNALAALSVATALGISLAQAGQALESFRGVKRRFEIVGTWNGITVLDDFAHNPDKIAATLNTLHETNGRIIAIFQPHGFGPTRLLKDGLIETFSTHLSDTDILLMPEIYYAGGTANKDISSSNIIDAVVANGKTALFLESRAAIRTFLTDNARPGDRIVVMGARDDTLPEFAFSILESLKQKAA